MSKGDHIELQGTIVKSEVGRDFTVEVSLPNGTLHRAICALKGNIFKNKISVVPGDSVQILLSAYDLSRGLISKRLTKSK
jgi:translation initiation factor IF-1